ncbi:MAG: hypothetical protein R2705_10765 [Ilumatobacteraceae bacterium]
MLADGYDVTVYDDNEVSAADLNDKVTVISEQRHDLRDGTDRRGDDRTGRQLGTPPVAGAGDLDRRQLEGG